MPTLGTTVPYYGGEQVPNPANVLYPPSVPNANIKVNLGTIAVVNATSTAYMAVSHLGGVTTWAQISSGGSGDVATINSLSPSAGNIIIAGTANQIAVNNAGHTVTLSVPSGFVAPTSVTATSGNITATNGNFVASTAGTGLLLNPAAVAGTTTATLNGRVGQVTITTPSIAAGATAVMTITNSAITGSSTQVGYWLTGGTTGAALTIQSYVNTAGQSVVTIQNGTGATTNTASLILNFLVLN